MTSQTLKRNCKNLFTNSERLCSLERNIPKIKLSLNDKSIDRSLPSPRLKAFPPEKIKRINDNISLQSTIRENLLCNTRQNIGHGDAISNHEKLTMISNSQFIRKEQKNKNIAYFHPIENENQSESILITEKNSPSLSTYRSFAPNSLSASAIQQCSSRNKATPRPIVSHLPSHRDNISNSEPKTDSQKTKIDPENTKNPEKISSPENQESVIQHSETLKKHEKIGKITENEKMTKNEENNEFILDNCENETNYEKQPIGGRIGATYRESYLKENTNFQKEFPHKELKQQVMKQLSMSAPVYHQRHSIDSNNLFDKCPTRSQMENIKQVDQQLHNSICQQRDIAFDRNHHSMEQKQNSCNFYNSNFCHIMTSPQDFSLNRQKCYYQNLKMNSNNFQVHSNNLTVNPNNFQANANNLKVNSKNLQDNLKNFQVNPNNFQINPNNFQDNPNNLQVNTNNFQVSANNLQVNPNKFQDNLNCYQDNSNNSQTIFNNNCQATLNDKFSQDNYLLQMNPNNRTHFTSFSLDLVNPELKQLQAETEERQQIVPNDNYSHNNHTNHNKMTIKSTDMQQRSKISNKVYYFTPQMLKDQELLLTTMQQQQFSEDMMMRQFQLLLNEQKKQLAYLESCTQTEEKIIRRVKNNVSKKITAKNSIDEKPDWMAHITPPRITYCEMEKIKCYGFDIQQSNWNCENRQGVDESDQQRCDDKCQNWRQCQEKHQDRQRQEYQRHDQKSECLTWNHQQEQKNLSNKNFRVEQNQCGKSQSDFERYQHFRMQNKNRHRHAEMHHQNSHVDQKMHHHHRGQHCLHKRHQQAELQKQSMANHFQQLGHNQGYIQQPLIQNQTSLIPSQQSFVHQQSPNQQSLMHQKFVVPQHQLLVPQQQLMVADQKSLAPQQLMEPNQKTMVPQQQLMVADQKSLVFLFYFNLN
ncbi:putative uncharacterized protein DDB_G0282133 isoform X2 [Leptopilina heterotoma]|uniref:putative uncharacterized protein DDB_G0282133 isoform X2 n=1 Tax=Leptopilina heterotoma TaxID=63436 RepID=UPI001CA8164F|nr:putative uncharacterized protein DDB_G0282133 isoform X2 [Leptopilina heterotoma]